MAGARVGATPLALGRGLARLSAVMATTLVLVC